MLSLSSRVRNFAAVEPVDFRKGFDGLVEIVRDVFSEDPSGGDLFCLSCRRRERQTWAHRTHPLTWARSFAQRLAWLRAESVATTVFASGPRARRSRRIARGFRELLTIAASVA